MGLNSGKNFVSSNAVDVILAVPVNRHRPSVDYLKKEDYGRVPVSFLLSSLRGSFALVRHLQGR